MKSPRWALVTDDAGKKVHVRFRGHDRVVRKYSSTLKHIRLYANGMRPTLVYAHEVFAPGLPLVPIIRALKTPSPSGAWWVNAIGILERTATIYEERTITPPRTGWRLVTGEEAARITAERRAGSGPREVSELDEEIELARVQRKWRAAEASVAHAAEMLRRWERRAKTAATKTKAYGARLTRAHAALLRLKAKEGC